MTHDKPYLHMKALSNVQWKFFKFVQISRKEADFAFEFFVREIIRNPRMTCDL